MKTDVTAGMGALRRRVAVLLPLALMAAWPLTAEKGPELPFELWRAIVSGDPPVMVRCDWQRLRGLSFVQRAMEMKNLSDVRKLPMIGTSLQAATVAEPVLGEIRVIYSAMKDPEGSSGARVWALTALDQREIGARLHAAGWFELPGSSGVYVEPFEEHDHSYCEYLLKKHENEEGYDRDSAIKEVAKAKWKISIGDGGWVHVSLVQPEFGKACCLFAPDLEDLEKQGFRFPFDRLLDDDDSSLCRMAIDTPKNEMTPEEASSFREPKDERQRLQDELERLNGPKNDLITRDVGDMLFIASEVDGGIAIDVESRAPGGGGGARTVDMLEGGLIALRLVILWAGPRLSEELDSAVFRDLGDHVAGSVVLSGSSLFEAVDRAVHRSNRTDEIYVRLREIDHAKTTEQQEQ